MNSTVIVNTSARYWNIWRIYPAGGSLGYNKITLTAAKDFIYSLTSKGYSHKLQDVLLSYFYGEHPQSDTNSQALAGLCLRCYISEAIIKECKKIDCLFSGNKLFSYRDLLPFVLNDDGISLAVLDEDRKTQLTVDDAGKKQHSKYNLFSIKVLQTFNINLKSRMSLDNWTYLQTRQNCEIKNFLSEFGLQHVSDWALLNRVNHKQLKSLSVKERHIIEAYHAVYRRDRQKRLNNGSRKCTDPTSAQLQEMLVYLQKYQISTITETLLLAELRQIASRLRTYDIWSSREYLDIYDTENNRYMLRNNLYAESLDEADIEREEFLTFSRSSFKSTLINAIEQEIEANIQRLKNSKRYAPFAQKYLQGLELYYENAMTLKEITPVLGMTSWSQARRILNPGELLSQVRCKTVGLMLEKILKLAADKGLTQIPPEASYFKNLAEKVEFYLDREIFQEAAEELRAGKNHTMKGVYAQAIRSYIKN